MSRRDGTSFEAAADPVRASGAGGSLREARTVRRTVGLGALLAAMHMALLTRRLAPVSGDLGLAIAAWRWDAGAVVDSAPRPVSVRSNPVTTYNVGQLPLATGVAVVALAFWLQIMHISGVVGR